MKGVIHAIKPPGMTSSNLVVALKKILNTKKIGHTGTLDPGACGVLSVCVGRATKIADYLMAGRKTYITEVTFGKSTDTLDSYGKEASSGGSLVTYDELRDACEKFTGEISQIPPMYSAIKVDGQKMYSLARQGKEVLLPARQITVYSIEILGFNQAQNICLLQIECSKGTYIRSLCADMAKEMCTMGYTSFLLRTRTGNAEISQAFTLAEIEERAQKADFGFMIPVDKAMSHYGQCVLEDYLFPILTTGTPIDLTKVIKGDEIPRNADLRVYCQNQFIGMGRAEEDMLKIKTLIYLREADV